MHKIWRFVGIDRFMVLNSVSTYFNYIVAVSAPIHIFLEFFLLTLCAILFPSYWLLSHIIVVETMDSGKRGMYPVAIYIINPWKEYGMGWTEQSDRLLSSLVQYRLSSAQCLLKACTLHIMGHVVVNVMTAN